jgi:hypothetical protein
LEPPPEVELEPEPELLLEELSLEEPPEFEDEPFEDDVLVGGGTLIEPAACEPIEVAIPTIPLILFANKVVVVAFVVFTF